MNASQVKSTLALVSLDHITTFDFDLIGPMEWISKLPNDCFMHVNIPSQLINNLVSHFGFKPIDLSRTLEPCPERRAFIEYDLSCDPLLTSLTFPGTNLRVYDQIAFDRLYWFIPNARPGDIQSWLLDLNIGRLVLVGTGGVDSTFLWSTAEDAMRLGIPILGIPLGFSSGRLSSFWINLCSEIIVTSETDKEFLKAEGVQSNIRVAVPKRLPKNSLQISPQIEKQTIFLDIISLSPRDDVLLFLQSLEKQKYENLTVFIPAGTERELYNLLYRGRVNVNIQYINQQDILQSLSSSTAIVSLFPFRVCHLKRALELPDKILLLDRSERFKNIDNCHFEDIATFMTIDDMLNALSLILANEV